MTQPNIEKWEVTPEWITKAKYISILQIVRAQNDWSQKYPLLEKIVDGLLETQRAEIIEKVERMRKLIPHDRYIPETESEAYNIAGRSGYNQALSDIISFLKGDELRTS